MMVKTRLNYWNINKNFELFCKKINRGGTISKGKFLKKLKKQFYNNFKIIEIIKSNKIKVILNGIQEIWLFFNIVASGSEKRKKLRINTLNKTKMNEKTVNRILMWHPSTELFFMTKSNKIIPESKKRGEFIIDFEWFFFFEENGNFSYEEKKQKKEREIIWVSNSLNEITEQMSVNKKREWLHIKLEQKEKVFEKIDLKERIKKIDSEQEKNIKLPLTEEEVETEKKIKSRKMQSQFRKDLILLYKKCPITNIDIQIILIASHIKPYSNCLKEQKKQEAADPKNGILLSPLWDKLLDEGLITFKNDGKILYSQTIPKELQIKLKGNISNENYHKIIKKNVNNKYLLYHQEKVFKK